MRAVQVCVGLALVVFPAAIVRAQRSAESLISQGRYEEALSELQRAPEETKATARWHLLSSKAYDGLRDPKHAVDEAQRALAVDPRNEASYLQLGQIFLSWNTAQPALEIFSSASALFPQSLPILLGRGIAELDLGRYKEAEQDLKSCLQKKPDLGIAFESLETTYLKTGQLEDAVNAARAYATNYPDDYRGHCYVAAATDEMQGDPKIVREALDAALRSKPDYVPAHVLEAKIALRAGETRRALDVLESAVRINSNYPVAHIELAKIYRKLGRNADAARELQIVEKLNADRGRTLSYHRGSPDARAQ